MILLSCTRHWRCGAFTMEPGAYYVGESTASTALMMNPDLELETTVNDIPLDPDTESEYEKILIVRSGGFGDLLFLTPMIRALRIKYPSTHIAVACWPHFQAVFAGNQDVDEVMNYPVLNDTFLEQDAVIWLEDAMEWEPKAKELHVVDLYAEKLGIPLTRGKHLDYFGHLPHMEAMAQRFPRKRDVMGKTLPRVGIQLAASARCRTYPARLTEQLIEHLAVFAEVSLFDVPREDARQAPKVDRILNLCGEDPPLTFAESTAVLASCDAVVAPDSALCHVAGALGIPTVALYGPFPSALRTRYAPSVEAIDGRAPCAPCFHHERESIWPQHGQCRKTGRCEALASIEPERIARKVKGMLKR